MLLALTSAALLIASFPNFNQPWCAWVALVPWLILLRQARGWVAFRWSWLIGFVFFLGSIWWLVYVTVFGWLMLCAYLALYFGVFGWLVSFACGDTLHVTRDKKNAPVTCHLSPVTTLAIPALWTALEYARSHLLSGFGWNLLAYSQAPWLALIQFADVTGAWGVSFLIVMANVGITQAISCRTQDSRHKTQPVEHKLESQVLSLVSSIGAPAVILALSLIYGFWSLGRSPVTTPPVLVSVVQGNIPQEQKWDEAYTAQILERYAVLTRRAAATDPDLIVWPETSVPGYFGVDEPVTQPVLRLAAEVGHSLLIGAPAPHLGADGYTLTNRASWIDPRGRILDSYDKLHLVPFGEFIPGDRAWPWLRQLLPPIGDFVSGRNYTVFKLGSRLKAQSKNAVGSRLQALGKNGSSLQPTASNLERSSLQPSAFSFQLRFSVLICFEDIFPELARRFVQAGAQLLVVITNDAWFGPTAAAYQHAQASTFRAVELRVPVARAANTGWSGCIDPLGRWTDSVRDERGGELFVAGTVTCALPLDNTPSRYRRWGDWFAWVCVLWGAIWAARRRLNLF